MSSQSVDLPYEMEKAITILDDIFGQVDSGDEVRFHIAIRKQLQGRLAIAYASCGYAFGHLTEKEPENDLADQLQTNDRS